MQKTYRLTSQSSDKKQDLQQITSRIPESLKMCLTTPNEANLNLSNGKTFQQRCPSYLKGWGTKIFPSTLAHGHSCERHLCTHLDSELTVLAWHDVSFNCSITVTEEVSLDLHEKTMLLFNKPEGIKIRGQSTETPQASLSRWVKAFGATLLISSCPKNSFKTFGICVSLVGSFLTTL